ncbi:MAG TPA: HEPN domain-containing protein [Armatimonadota bacterium]|nr:HEPN domain-containing protein [Armatimonadota bacterium]
MTRCIPKLFERARENAAVAEKLVADGHTEIAVSRAYYVMFYVAEALLAHVGQSYSKHSAVIAAYGKEYAKTDLLDPKFHRYLRDAFELRGDADYSLSVEFAAEKALEVVQWGNEFLEAAETHIDQTPSQPD